MTCWGLKKRGLAAFRLKGNVYLYPFSFPPLKMHPEHKCFSLYGNGGAGSQLLATTLL